SALGEVMEAQQKLKEVYAAYAEPDADFDKLAELQARYENIIATSGAALGSEDWAALRRREAPGGPGQAPALQARHAAPRRTHQPPGRRIGGVAGAVPHPLPRHRGGSDPRPLLPGQRRRVDPGVGPRPRHPLEGQLLLLAGAKGSPPGAGTEADRRSHEGDEDRAGLGPLQPQGAPSQE